VSTEVKIKQSLYRSGQALRTARIRSSQKFRNSAHESGKVVSPKNRPPLPHRRYPWYSYLLGAELTLGHSAARRIIIITVFFDR
jgi:hypothetical protein